MKSERSFVARSERDLDKMEAKIQRGAYRTRRREELARRRWWRLRRALWNAPSQDMTLSTRVEMQ